MRWQIPAAAWQIETQRDSACYQINLVLVLLSAVDGGIMNEDEDDDEEVDDDSDEDSDVDSDDSEREFRMEFKKYKAHYYTDKMDFERVTQ